VGTRAGRETDIELIRDGKRMTVKATPAPQTKFEIGDIGVNPDSHPLVGALLRARPRKQRPESGDVILRVDNSEILRASS
jgi:hypothetical protein